MVAANKSGSLLAGYSITPSVAAQQAQAGLTAESSARVRFLPWTVVPPRPPTRRVPGVTGTNQPFPE